MDHLLENQRLLFVGCVNGDYLHSAKANNFYCFRVESSRCLGRFIYLQSIHHDVIRRLTSGGLGYLFSLSLDSYLSGVTHRPHVRDGVYGMRRCDRVRQIYPQLISDLPTALVFDTSSKLKDPY